MSSILSAQNIHKAFFKNDNTRLEILKGVDLELKAHQRTIIVGASGAGKSTLLHILSGLDNADTGQVNILDQDISKMNDEKLSKFRNKELGFVFQFHHLLPEFTALENVSIPLMIKNESLKEAKEKAEKVLHLVGLKERLDHKPAELSGGEQQRIAVARAIVNNPKILFADEPTGNLDSKNSEVMHELFIKLSEELKITLLIVTHNPELVKLGNRVIEMKDGIIVEDK